MMRHMENPVMEPGEDQKNIPEEAKEEWGEETGKELVDLRKKQYGAEGAGEFTNEDRERLLTLQQQEDKEFKAPLSAEETEEMRELQKSQTKSEDWTPEKAGRLLKLQRREKAAKQEKEAA